MQTNELNGSKLRELADIRPEGAKVLSLYLNLDPTEFASAQARTTEMSSLLDEADRRLRNGDSLTHDEKAHLREDVDRVRAYFASADFSAKGAHGLAIFCSGPADVFEVIKLPRPVDTGVAINDAPFIEPLADLAFTGSWGIFLISRKMARILRGSREHLEEIARISDDVHGWHDQGGWSQARYQRGIEKETNDHVKHAGDVLFRRFRRNPFDKLLIGCPEEMCHDVEKRLHPYLQERIVGRIEVDVENTSPDQVLDAAAEKMELQDRKHEAEVRLGLGALLVAAFADLARHVAERGRLVLHDGGQVTEHAIDADRCLAHELTHVIARLLAALPREANFLPHQNHLLVYVGEE